MLSYNKFKLTECLSFAFFTGCGYILDLTRNTVRSKLYLNFWKRISKRTKSITLSNTTIIAQGNPGILSRMDTLMCTRTIWTGSLIRIIRIATVVTGTSIDHRYSSLSFHLLYLECRLKLPKFRSQIFLAVLGRGWITCEGDSPLETFR